MATLEELLDTPDPAWPELQRRIQSAKNPTEILPAAAGSGDRALLALQVTARSTLGALAHQTGGLSVDRGWLRVLGAPGPRMATDLLELNGLAGTPALVAGALVVGTDAAGGVFAANGGALPGPQGNVFYFAPDALAWEDLGVGHSAFVAWALEGDLAQFYEGARWPGWEAEVAAAGLDRAFMAHPPPWSKEGRDPAKVSRKPVPVRELATLHFQLIQKMAQG